jgi:hypothetical protein
MRSRRWRSGSVGPPDPGRGCPELVKPILLTDIGICMLQQAARAARAAWAGLRGPRGPAREAWAGPQGKRGPARKGGVGRPARAARQRRSGHTRGCRRDGGDPSTGEVRPRRRVGTSAGERRSAGTARGEERVPAAARRSAALHAEGVRSHPRKRQMRWPPGRESCHSDAAPNAPSAPARFGRARRARANGRTVWVATRVPQSGTARAGPAPLRR